MCRLINSPKVSDTDICVLTSERWPTYIIFLSFEFLTEIKLLSLQPYQPLPQFTGFLPENKGHKIPLIFIVMVIRGHCYHTLCTEVQQSSAILKFIFTEMVDVERLPAFSQDLLLLLPLSLFLGSFSVLTLQIKNKHKSVCITVEIIMMNRSLLKPSVQHCIVGSCLRGPSSSWRPHHASYAAPPVPSAPSPPVFSRDKWKCRLFVFFVTLTLKWGYRFYIKYDRTASLACLSFSLSALILCCSALSARRFS